MGRKADLISKDAIQNVHIPSGLLKKLFSGSPLMRNNISDKNKGKILENLHVRPLSRLALVN